MDVESLGTPQNPTQGPGQLLQELVRIRDGQFNCDNPHDDKKPPNDECHVWNEYVKPLGQHSHFVVHGSLSLAIHQDAGDFPNGQVQEHAAGSLYVRCNKITVDTKGVAGFHTHDSSVDFGFFGICPATPNKEVQITIDTKPRGWSSMMAPRDTAPDAVNNDILYIDEIAD